jgi:hypothetical protein
MQATAIADQHHHTLVRGRMQAGGVVNNTERRTLTLRWTAGVTVSVTVQCRCCLMVHQYPLTIALTVTVTVKDNTNR